MRPPQGGKHNPPAARRFILFGELRLDGSLPGVARYDRTSDEISLDEVEKIVI